MTPAYDHNESAKLKKHFEQQFIIHSRKLEALISNMNKSKISEKKMLQENLRKAVSSSVNAANIALHKKVEELIAVTTTTVQKEMDKLRSIATETNSADTSLSLSTIKMTKSAAMKMFLRIPTPMKITILFHTTTVKSV